MTRIVLVLVLVLGSFPAARAETLDSWIETALEKNPGLAATRQKWEAAKQKVPQARAFEDPVIGVDVERNRTRFNSYADNEYMISQKLPWFGKRGARGSVAALEAEVVGFAFLEEQRDLKAQVIAAHWDLWVAQRAVEIATQNRQLMEQFEQSARARYEAGKGMLPDVLRAQVELAKMSNEVVTMEREVPLMQSALNKLLNAEPNTPRRVDAPAEAPAIELTLEQLQARARAYCCILMSFLRAAEAKEAGVRVARLESAPDIELRVEARQLNGRSGIHEYDTGVFMNFPWLWRGKYRAMLGEAKAEAEMAQRELDAEINMTQLEVKELYTKAAAARRLMTLYAGDVLPRARQLVESTRAAYESGEATFLELVEAQKAARDFELDYERARADYGRAHAKLDTFIAPWAEREFATGLVTPDMK